MPRIPVTSDVLNRWSWPDEADTDADDDGVDVTDVSYARFNGRTWTLELRGWPQTAGSIDPDTHVIAYGVVLDDGADGTADCVIGVSNEAMHRGEYRIWVHNLTTGNLQEHVGAPSGWPVEVRHPDDGHSLWPSVELSLGGNPCDMNPREQPAFYAWASESVDGQVVAWDYGPDDGWLVPTGD
jgi:hypothetical protein